jgi:FixJ family two-component response regulator
MRRFHASLDELPTRCREAFVLNQIEGRTRVEIAAQLGLSVRTVDRHILRAFAHVRRKLQGPEHFPASRTQVGVAKIYRREEVELVSDRAGSEGAGATAAPRKVAA